MIRAFVSNFFTNPRGEYDSRKAQLAKDYWKKYKKHPKKETSSAEEEEPSTKNIHTYILNTQNREIRPYPVQDSTGYRRDENQFRKQFISQDSGYQPNGYSFNDGMQYQNFSQPSQHQASKKETKQETSEEYFPFGKPGAGAPMRDSQGQIVTKRPAGFTNNKGDPVGTVEAEKQRESVAYQDKRETLKDNWRKALNE